MIADIRLTTENLRLEKWDKISFAQANTNISKTAGTLICIPKNYTNDKSKIIFYNKYDRYTLIALTNNRGSRIILGALYLRLALLRILLPQ